MDKLENKALEEFEVIRTCYDAITKEFEKLRVDLSTGDQTKLKQIAFDESADLILDALKLKEDAIVKIISDEKKKWINVSAKQVDYKTEWLEMSISDVQQFKDNLQGHCETSLLEEHRHQLFTTDSR